MTSPRFSRRHINAGLAAGLLFAPLTGAAASRATVPTASARLTKIADDYYKGKWALFPMDATESIGDPAYEAAFEIEIAPGHRARQERFYKRTLASLRGVNTAQLSRAERFTYDLLTYEAQDQLTHLAVHYARLTPVGHMGSMPVKLSEWATGKSAQPMKTAAHFDHFLARLKRLPEWIFQAIANMEEGMAQGVVLPRALVERTLPQLEALLPNDPLASPYLAATREMPSDMAEADRRRIVDAYRQAVTQRIAPAVQRLHAFLASRYLPAARATAGMGSVPGGREGYRSLVRYYTTGDMSPEQIHELGLKEVARIRADMEQVKSRFGFEGDLDAFFRSLPERKELTPFKSEPEIIAAFVALNDRIKAGLPRLFDRAPKAGMEVRAVEPISRATASDNYVPPAADGSRPGTFFFVPTEQPAEYRTTRMTALLLHEGQPGHHYQMALQQELDVPRFRKSLWYDAFGEGWALYAESLGRELGLFDDPNAYLGRLQMELHRALRLVVDTGMHDKGWSREKAIAYMREVEGASEADARRAIERYMAWPGQALAYKVGELKIIELRERARAKMGARFDIRAFHTQVLGDGCMPLRMLEAKIDAWIAAAA